MESSPLDDFPLSDRGGRKGYTLSPLELQVLAYIRDTERGGSLVFFFAVVNEFRPATHSTKRIERAIQTLYDLGYVGARHSAWASNPVIYPLAVAPPDNAEHFGREDYQGNGN